MNGFWRPLPKRDPAPARQAVEEAAPKLLAGTSAALQGRTIELIAKLGARADFNLFLAWVGDAKRPLATRLAALRSLAARRDSRLESAIQAAMSDREPKLRNEARSILAGLDPDRATKAIESVLNDAASPVVERQHGLALLAGLKTNAADLILARWAERLAADKVPGELQLDVFEAASARSPSVPAIERALATFESTRSKTDPLARSRASLLGGDAGRGRAVFVGHRQAECARCHKIAEQSAAAAGPDLRKIATRADREYFLQSLLDPSAKIAPGFGSVVLSLADGKLVAGTIKSEDKENVVVETPEGKLVTVAVGEIDERTPPKSAMPAMGAILSPRDIRDLIEFLSTLK